MPSSIFVDRDLAPLESLTAYLREEEGLSYHEIAVLVGRDDRTIWTCYSRAQKKRSSPATATVAARPSADIPVAIFKDRSLAPLETLTNYLKESEGLSFHEIAVLLNRDDRTVWTCYDRSRKKLVHN